METLRDGTSKCGGWSVPFRVAIITIAVIIAVLGCCRCLSQSQDGNIPVGGAMDEIAPHEDNMPPDGVIPEKSPGVRVGNGRFAVLMVVSSGAIILSIYALICLYMVKRGREDLERELILAKNRAENLNIKLDAALKAAREAECAESAEKNFLATMSHEIRTPLNAVIGFSNLLKNSEDFSPEEVKSYSQSINVAGEALLQLLNDILDLSKLDADKMTFTRTPCDLSVLLRSFYTVFSLRMKEKNLKYELNLPDNLPTLMLDKGKVRQSLFNIWGNAIKFTDKGGITISVDWVPTDEKCGALKISIKDTGCGIAPQFQKNIFDPFTQQDAARDAHKLNGTGLGMAITKRIVDKAGGTLSVKSEVGVGSDFIIELPHVLVSDEKDEENMDGEASSTWKSTVRTALIVDDVAMNLKVLAAILMKVGVMPISASSAKEVLKIMEEKGNEIDVVLTDLWMPEMNGVELAGVLKSSDNWRSTPVIVVTADTELKKNFDTINFDGFLYKPITVAGVQKLLSSVCRKH